MLVPVVDVLRSDGELADADRDVATIYRGQLVAVRTGSGHEIASREATVFRWLLPAGLAVGLLFVARTWWSWAARRRAAGWGWWSREGPAMPREPRLSAAPSSVFAGVSIAWLAYAFLGAPVVLALIVGVPTVLWLASLAPQRGRHRARRA